MHAPSLALAPPARLLSALVCQDQSCGSDARRRCAAVERTAEPLASEGVFGLRRPRLALARHPSRRRPATSGRVRLRGSLDPTQVERGSALSCSRSSAQRPPERVRRPPRRTRAAVGLLLTPPRHCLLIQVFRARPAPGRAAPRWPSADAPPRPAPRARRPSPATPERTHGRHPTTCSPPSPPPPPPSAASSSSSPAPFDTPTAPR